MININQLQSPSAMAQLLGIQQPTQTSTAASAQANPSQTAGLDSLSISSAALQALQGLGLDATQTQTDQASATYTAHGHHHHHHHGTAQVPQGTSAQTGNTSSQSSSVPQVSQTAGGPVQANS
jgi:hypothetical protein